MGFPTMPAVPNLRIWAHFQPAAGNRRKRHQENSSSHQCCLAILAQQRLCCSLVLRHVWSKRKGAWMFTRELLSPPPDCSAFETPGFTQCSQSFAHGNFACIRREQKMQDPISRKHRSRSHRAVERSRESRAQLRLQCCKRLDLYHAPQGSLLVTLVPYLCTAGQRKWGQIYLQSCPNHAFIFSAGPFLKSKIPKMHTCHEERLTGQLQEVFLSRRLRVNCENETECLFLKPSRIPECQRLFLKCLNSSKNNCFLQDLAL